MNKKVGQQETWMLFNQIRDGIFIPQAMDRNLKKFSNLL